MILMHGKMEHIDSLHLVAAMFQNRATHLNKIYDLVAARPGATRKDLAQVLQMGKTPYFRALIEECVTAGFLLEVSDVDQGRLTYRYYLRSQMQK